MQKEYTYIIKTDLEKINKKYFKKVWQLEIKYIPLYPLRKRNKKIVSLGSAIKIIDFKITNNGLQLKKYKKKFIDIEGK